MHSPVTGILGAMPEEIEAVLHLMGSDTHTVEHGNRAFTLGSIGKRSVVAAYSRCGKVAAAATATEMIVRFNATEIIFTGLAGALDDRLRIGDVVIATELMQHDLDARPLFPRYEVPLAGVSRFACDAALRSQVESAADALLQGPLLKQLPEHVRARLGLTKPRLYSGLIVSGDQFIGSDSQRAALRRDLPDALCVEMEGAAVVQVAHDYAIPAAVVRVISDAADDHAGAHFPESLSLIAGVYASGIIERICCV